MPRARSGPAGYSSDLEVARSRSDSERSRRPALSKTTTFTRSSFSSSVTMLGSAERIPGPMRLSGGVVEYDSTV